MYQEDLGLVRREDPSKRRERYRDQAHATTVPDIWAE